jgi:hypothetical protein
MFTQFSDHLLGRYFTYTLANSASQAVTHNFGLAIGKLKIIIFESGVQLTEAQIVAAYTITQTSTSIISVQNVSGGSKTFLIYVIGYRYNVTSSDFDANCSIVTTGNIEAAELRADGNDLVLNYDAAGSTTDWKGTIRRPSSGMSAAAIWTMPTATSTIATLALAETLSNKTLTLAASITLVASGAIDWAAGNVALGASIGANTMTIGGASSTVRVAGLMSALTLKTDSNDLVLNSGAAGSAADWLGTIRRPSSGMTGAAVWTMPLATATLASLALAETLSNKTLTVVASITLAASGAIDWAAGAVSVGASIGANTLTLGGTSSTVRVAGLMSSLTLKTDSSDLVLNNATASSGADWLGTFRRPAVGMTVAAIWTMPIATCTILGDSIAATITNKIYDGGTASATNRFYIPKDTKTNLDGLTKTSGMLVWATDLKTLYVGDGTNYNVVGSGGGGGSSGTWNAPSGVGALLSEQFSEKVYLFPDAIDAELDIYVKVPNGYVAGSQINMDIGLYSASASNTILLVATTYLFAKNSTALSATTNSYSSTNSALTNTVANMYRSTTLDLSSSTGTINSVAIAAGDLLRVKITRNYATDTDTADVSFLPSATSVRFS